MTTDAETLETLRAQAEFAKTLDATIDEIHDATIQLAILNNIILRDKFSGPRPAIMAQFSVFLALMKKYYNGKDGSFETHVKNYVDASLLAINPEALDIIGKIF